MFNSFWLSSDKIIREREGFGWLSGLQWVQGQPKVWEASNSIFYLVSFHFCSSHLSSVNLLLFHICYNFISISFQCYFNFLSILFYLFIILVYFTNFLSVLYCILFNLLLFNLIFYHNLLTGHLQHQPSTITLPNHKDAYLDNWEQQIL